jgi:5-formyltetrahydrofolate cyclo-ligase
VAIPSLDARKERLRQTMQGMCASFSAEQALSAGEAISDELSAWSGWLTASVVAVFATLPGEVDTRPLTQLVLREGKRLVFPRMVAGSTLEFALVEDPESLRPGRYGVLEPSRKNPALSIGGDAVVCVPGLAFDRAGGRLGRGAGYYDRALAVSRGTGGRPRMIGVGFARQIVESVPMGPLDVRMDAIFTEAGLLGMA